MKRILLAPLFLFSSLSFAGTNAFICSDNLNDVKICDVTKSIQSHINEYKFKGEMTPILFKKLYIESAVLINKNLKLNTVFSEAIDSKNMEDKEFKKNTLQKTFKSICRDKNLRKYISLGGSITLKFNFTDKSYRNLPNDMFIRSCQTPPTLVI